MPGIGNALGVPFKRGISVPNEYITWSSVDDPVKNSGLDEASWVYSGAYGNGTIIFPRFAVRSHGVIQNFRIRTGAATGATWKLKAFRWNAGTSLYDFIAESTFIPVATSTQTITLSTPLPVEPADILGLYCPAGNAYGYDATNYGIQARLVNGSDITTPNAFATEWMITPLIDLFGTRPYLCYIGDSIIAGMNGVGHLWVPWDNSSLVPKSIPGGFVNSEPGYIVRSLIGTELYYQNHSRTATGFAIASTNSIVTALAVHPHTVIIATGGNDIIGGAVSWAQASAYLDTIKTLFDASDAEELMVSEILPRDQFNDVQAATCRTWNINLAAWCTTNGATLIVCHDAMGQIRVSTGQLDDLITAYNFDDVHLTDAGVAAYGAIIASYLP